MAELNSKLTYTKGATSITVNVYIESSITVTAGLTGLAFNSAGLVAYFVREKSASVAITLATQTTTGAWSSGGFVEVDATNMPGIYRLDIPDACFASGSNSFIVLLKGATNMQQCQFEMQLVDTNPRDAVRGGMTALPNANAAAANGLPVLGANATAISFTSGMIISNASGDALALTSSGGNGNGLNATGNGSGNGLLGTAGATGNGIKGVGGGTSGAGIAGNASFNSSGISGTGNGTGSGIRGVAGATGNGIFATGGSTSGSAISGTTTSGDALSLVATAGNGITATGNGTSKHGVVATGGTAGTSDGIKAVAGTGGVDIRGNITGNITGALSGSVSSVSGAVGSVTGNVGGSVASVTGSVDSVTNAVGSVTGSVGSVTSGVTITTNNDKSGYALSATGSAALTESYAADGSPATLAQLLYLILATLTEKSISGTTMTAKKLDGSTTAATFTLNDATTPTAITRAS